MSDQYLPPSPDQHDTAAYPRPVPPSAQAQGPYAGYGAGYGAWYGAGNGSGTATGYAPGGPAQDWYVPGQASSVGNPEAEYWAGRFRRQRTLSRVVIAVAALGAVATLGLGIAAVQAFRSNPVVAAAERLGDSLGQGSEQVIPAPGEDGAQPDGAQPPSPESPGPANPDGQAIPLPEPLQGLGNALGITDARQLLDLAVANGLISQEDADKLRAAIEAGQALQGLTGGDEGPTES